MPHNTDTYQDRRGHCYELAYRYVTNHPGSKLVHGSIGGPRAANNHIGAPVMGHAWAITADGKVYDAVLGAMYSVEAYRHYFDGQPWITYPRTEAMLTALIAGSYGPWDKEFDAQDDIWRVAHTKWQEAHPHLLEAQAKVDAR